jgi:hypothetical protein
VTRLWAAVRCIENGDRDEAAAHTELLIRAMPDEEDASGSTLVRTFAEALLARVRQASTAGGNLYLDARPPGAQLRAFELLRLRTPRIAFAYAAGNRALLDSVGEDDAVTIIDIGIGRAGQLRSLLRNPSARQLRSVHVVGIEPDSSTQTGTGALEIAEQNVLRSADEVGIEASFAGVARRAEELTLEDLKRAGLRGRVLANASFALHHVPASDNGWGRDAVLRLLLEAGAETCVLVEPDTDHFVSRLASRFLHAYRHYGTVARSLRAMLSPGDAHVVWSEFFAPEVRNVIGHELPERSELHEESARWTDRLTDAGWHVEATEELLPQAAAPPGFSVRQNHGAFSLSFQGVDVLSVLRAKSS